ncbi:hypothetical protein U2261_11490 [Achromobacter xylosoxidans]|uniref:hypothetical protein n=1 Tax=Alcaligenes xylosoxydans xylosoxydans TaxID=85698 RepID=UPI0012F4DD0A|nr:hypothetical protein [Achromobacter xylosoxidans]MDZ5615232.1 hypothetical protein [Achromobacter xylosoxidans]MDZ5623964.1 hypothetical protein [Achromobacter xylosoxidans]MDZ5683652.1 hypothetical protein [Achromobacter xylosoxidans]
MGLHVWRRGALFSGAAGLSACKPFLIANRFRDCPINLVIDQKARILHDFFRLCLPSLISGACFIACLPGPADRFKRFKLYAAGVESAAKLNQVI